MKSVESLLSSVYNKQEIAFVTDCLSDLRKKYKSKIKSESIPLSEKDTCLIVYGDQVKEPDTPTLATLTKFLNNDASFISTVHILPFYPYSSDDGFSVIDYFEVNKELGSWSDITTLASSRRLMFDAVINHVSQHSKWFEGYLTNDPAYEEYFINEDPLADLSDVTRPRVSPLLHEFTDSNESIKNVWTTFSKDQVDLNYRNPRVFVHIVEVLLHYIANGASLLRLDAIGFMWKERGSTCIHLPQTHALVKAIKAIVKSYDPNICLISETNVPHLENISYFGNGFDEADMVYNFALPPLLAYSLLSGSTNELVAWAQSLSLPSDEVCFFNFTASHDGLGVRPVDGLLTSNQLELVLESAVANNGRISFKKNKDGSEDPYEINCNYRSLLKGNDPDEVALKRFLISQAVVLAMPGLPAIYFHSLVGSENDLEGLSRTGQNRSINREKMGYIQLKAELNHDGTIRNTIFKNLRHLIQIRAMQPAFHPFGEFEFADYGTGIFAISRWTGQQKIEAIFNFSNNTKTVSPKLKAEYRNILDGLIIGSGENLSLDGLSFAWLESNFPK
jgi:sucrose phosphorylase